MNLLRMGSLSTILALLFSCSALKTPLSNQYQLSTFGIMQKASKPLPITLLVSAPEAMAGYQTEQMLYINKPFKVQAFAKNSWTSPPAEMLYPLLVQSVQNTGFFYAVASSPYSAQADYRLDTQLLTLQQNFLTKPSVLEFSAKIVLTKLNDSKVVASRLITLKIPCPSDTPYGGVLAANQASKKFTEEAVHFVIAHVRHPD